MPAVLAEVVRQMPLSPEKVAFAWRIAVGPALARSTSVRLDEHGTLHVSTNGAAWTAAVKSASSLIQSRLDDSLGSVVKQMKFETHSSR